MRGLTDVRILWALGAVNLIFSAVGLFAAASAMGLLLYIAGLPFGASWTTVTNWLLYTSPLWAPIGAGAGIGVSAVLLRGVRRESAQAKLDV